MNPYQPTPITSSSSTSTNTNLTSTTHIPIPVSSNSIPDNVVSTSASLPTPVKSESITPLPVPSADNIASDTDSFVEPAWCQAHDEINFSTFDSREEAEDAINDAHQLVLLDDQVPPDRIRIFHFRGKTLLSFFLDTLPPDNVKILARYNVE